MITVVIGNEDERAMCICCHCIDVMSVTAKIICKSTKKGLKWRSLT